MLLVTSMWRELDGARKTENSDRSQRRYPNELFQGSARVEFGISAFRHSGSLPFRNNFLFMLWRNYLRL
jgi:hypothetical protein